ncbi:PaaI family thioesterase [bacterium]|nr:PaaI family thioesterase [bacterium]
MDSMSVLRESPLPFADFLGLRLRSATPDRIEAELEVRDELCTRPAVMHGGAMMAFADSLGGYAAALNLPDGAATTTLESKTNFFAAAPVGTKIIGECTPLHRGRRTMVWQTRLMSPEGRLLALVTQTQMVLEGRAPRPAGSESGKA